MGDNWILQPNGMLDKCMMTCQNRNKNEMHMLIVNLPSNWLMDAVTRTTSRSASINFKNISVHHCFFYEELVNIRPTIKTSAFLNLFILFWTTNELEDTKCALLEPESLHISKCGAMLWIHWPETRFISDFFRSEAV